MWFHLFEESIPWSNWCHSPEIGFQTVPTGSEDLPHIWSSDSLKKNDTVITLTERTSQCVGSLCCWCELYVLSAELLVTLQCVTWSVNMGCQPLRDWTHYNLGHSIIGFVQGRSGSFLWVMVWFDWFPLFPNTHIHHAIIYGVLQWIFVCGHCLLFDDHTVLIFCPLITALSSGFVHMGLMLALQGFTLHHWSFGS